MSVYLSEYGGAGLRLEGHALPSEPALAVTVVSSGSGAQAGTLGTATKLVRIAATANAWAMFTGSTSTATGITSTNDGLLQPNVAAEYRLVQPGTKWQILST